MSGDNFELTHKILYDSKALAGAREAAQEAEQLEDL